MDVGHGLSIYYVPGIILDAGDTEADQIGKVSALKEFTLQPKETDNNQAHISVRWLQREGKAVEKTNQGDAIWSDGATVLL